MNTMIKKVPFFSLICIVVLFLGCAENNYIYVSPSGSNNNPGTIESPLATLQAAIKKSRGMSVKPDIVLDGGTYYLNETIVLKPEDSGTEQNPLIIKAKEGEKVVISGGKRLDLRWEKYQGGIFKAWTSADGFEQLYINGKKQYLARYPNFQKNVTIFNGWAADAIALERVKNWDDPAGGYVHALSATRWGSLHYIITGKKNNGELKLKGGWQINRQSTIHPKYRFVENIFEELDAPGEWYLDSQADTLYYYPPEGIDLENALVEVSVLDQLIEFRGTQSNPVHDIVLEGITFTQTQRTFMKTKEPLLRSDWKIYRGGAVSLEGTEDTVIRNSVFKQLGGNAIFVSNYNRHVKITGNIIKNIGASAICFVGDPGAVRSPSFQYQESVPAGEMDTIPGPKTPNYPSKSLVKNNLIHHIGRIEKQTAGVMIAMASKIDIVHNTIYHVPRAGITINTAAWGGHLIAHNDVFKTVLETGDHGAFNSWGRGRYWHPNRAVMDSLVKVHPDWVGLDAVYTTTIRNNRFCTTNGWDIDLDDGSTNYKIYNNLCLCGGIKLREGFYRIVENNIIINNSLHPHVWFGQSHDTIRRNIFMTRIQDIRLKGWGDLIDYNFYTDSTDLTYSQSRGVDKHSIAGNPQFVAPKKGNYSVKKDSPVLAIGFENFPMDQFGVISEKLEALAPVPDFPTPVLSTDKKSGMIFDWLGVRIKSVETLGEQSAAGLKRRIGVLVLQVKKGSPAGKAGLQEGDVILELNGVKTPTAYSLLQAYQGQKWKEQLVLRIFRNQASSKIIISKN